MGRRRAHASLLTCKDCPQSTVWRTPLTQRVPAAIRECFHASIVDAMMDQVVVCAGTIMGGRTALTSYLQLMFNVAHFITKDSCDWGFDQVTLKGPGTSQSNMVHCILCVCMMCLFRLHCAMRASKLWCSSAGSACLRHVSLRSCTVCRDVEDPGPYTALVHCSATDHWWP